MEVILMYMLMVMVGESWADPEGRDRGSGPPWKITKT